MGKGQHDAGFRHVRMLFNVGTAGSLTDGQLLERFTAKGGEAAELAFATLVERHGAMVLRVCRSVLRDSHEAQDAFQATFLVLARRARSLWVRDSLGPWLHQVAYRVASSARTAASRRARHERRAAELSGPAIREEDRDDVGDVLHDEVNRLPWGCRAAVVLCYFEGLTPDQAARQLGCPVGTVQSRLARGRARLRSRLTQRGLAPALGALGIEVAAEAAPVVPPAALLEATVQAALPASAMAAPTSASVIRLTEGVLRSMVLIKLRTVAASVIAVAALAAGANALLQDAPAPKPAANPDEIRAELGAQPVGAGQAGDSSETGPPPQNLVWTDVPPAETPRVVEQLAALSKANYEKLKTWRGSYAYVQRQYLNEQFVAQLRAGAPAVGDKPSPPAKSEGLMQEFDSTLKFAIDTKLDAIYRDVETKRMRFLKLGTGEEVKFPRVGTRDQRSILTPEFYLSFCPTERSTSAFLPNHPDAQMKRRAERFAATEARTREGGTIDPRAFFKIDGGNFFWRSMEIYAQAIRGELGGEFKDIVAQRLKISRADGPDGRWYREQMGYTNGRGPILWASTLWSPEAGYHPVSTVRTVGTLDAKPQSMIEWRWKRIDGVYIPSTIHEKVYQGPEGILSREQRSSLKECVVNRPLDAHQFDERALGLSDGDLLLNHPERVAYIIKGGEPVKLADFGEGSILRPSRAKPATATTRKGGSGSSGKIYTVASLGTNSAGMPTQSVVTVDPDTGDVTKVVERPINRFRISPDRRNVAYVSIDTSASLPSERFQESLWIAGFSDGSKPKQVIPLAGTGHGGLPVWSPDGKRLILSLSTRDETRKQWVFETIQVNSDGTGRQSLKIPSEDGVQDWSSDGRWVVTTSSRNAKIGWQLYVMTPDGTNPRQVTEGGNPFYARFSPDGRRLLYSDGPSPDRRGIWVVDLDGTHRQRVLPTGSGTASACWSPDGQRIAVAIQGSSPTEFGRLEIVNPDGTHRTLLTMPSREIADMPDWR
jgi:RNA polymerase sigma factor (sigma-70 family)